MLLHLDNSLLFSHIWNVHVSLLPEKKSQTLWNYPYSIIILYFAIMQKNLPPPTTKYCQKEQHSSKGICKNLDYQSYGAFTIPIILKNEFKSLRIN